LEFNENISVVIPNYNRSEQLKAAIESALNQTLPPLEVLVCDDGSTENIKTIVDAFDNERVKFIACGVNKRPAVPRNIGIEHAKGEWIAFLDNDDTWHPEKLKHQAEYIGHADFICTNANVVGAAPGSKIMHPIIGDVYFNFYQILQTNHIVCSSVLAKKSVLLKAGKFPESPKLKALEDYALWLRISTFAPIKFLSKALVNYTDVSDTSIRKDSLSTAKQMERIHDDFVNWYKHTASADQHYIDLAHEVLLRRYQSKFKKNLHRLLFT